jgi:N-acyl homoserine lactone hydrolase
MRIEAAPAGTIRRLYVLDFGLFQVNDNGRLIGIPGYLIQTDEGANILVDTGFPARYADEAEAATLEDGLESFGRVVKLDHGNLPAAQLALIGLKPNDIDLLVMTHSDIDHVGGIADFPQAPIIIGSAERALDRPRYWNDRSPIEWPQDVAYRLVQEDMLLAPGLALLSSPGHSPGHISLLMRLPQTGTVLITGDAISRPSELEDGFGGAWDETKAASSAKQLMAVARREEAIILYGHDPSQWQTLRKAPRFYD